MASCASTPPVFLKCNGAPFEDGGGAMRSITRTEVAFIELAAVRPLTKLSVFHLSIATRLANSGLVSLQDGQWYPTAAGLRAIKQTLH